MGVSESGSQCSGSMRDLLRSGAAKLVSLMAVACLSGVTDSVMSPYLCPLVRDRTGAGNTMCGIIISARFATHIIFILLFGQLMSRIAARTIFLSSVALCGIFNMALASIALIKEE